MDFVRDDSSSGRVLPKVFADVPSAEELYRAKQSSRQLVIVTVLLAGALIAAVSFLVYVLSSGSDDLDRVLTEANKKVEIAEGKVLAAETTAKQNAADLARLNTKFDGLSTLADVDADVTRIRNDIAKKISEPVYTGVRGGVVSKELWDAFDNKVKWTVFDNSDWHRYVEENLSRRRDQLQVLKQRIDDWTPPRRTVPVAPKPCTAADPKYPNC
ncbi:MAG: hypothetical protein SGJ21_00600 [Alphaproteobacteria bacterium]|nr:hypothetical protein [Alphaproteobacteria bacterium]